MAYTAWSVVFGEQPSAAKWNILGTNDAHFYSFLGDNTAWQDWTPTFVNLSGGTLNYSKYIVIGKTVFFRWKYTLAGAGVGGSVTFSTPTTITSGMSATSEFIPGTVSYIDTGTSAREGVMRWASSTTVSLAADNGTTVLVVLSSTVPHTWANTDVIAASGFYESA